VQDDPHQINLDAPSAWELAAKDGCFGQRCNYDLQALSAEGQVIVGPVVLKPTADGSYRGRSIFSGDCVDLQDPSTVAVPNGYNDTELYRLEPGPYVGMPPRQRPTTFTIAITEIGTSTPEAKAKANCPDVYEVSRGTAERS
jgi:hypothetical protein